MTLSPPAVLVTGAAGGIGNALVTGFEAAGWLTVSTDRMPLARRDHITAELEVLAEPDSDAAQQFFDAVRCITRGRLKAVVNNAAFQIVKPATELTAHDWKRTLEVNLLAPFHLAIAFRDEISTNRGCVLAISSIHEKLTKPEFVAYATSKAALSGMTRALAVEMGACIRFNAISPAAVATPMLRAGFEGREEALRSLEAHHPAGRIGTPEEVAALAVFVCSDAAAFINGACLDLNGGIGARLHDPV